MNKFTQKSNHLRIHSRSILLLICVSASLRLCVDVEGQTNLPSSGALTVLTNLPSVALSQETVGVSLGTVMHGASSFENSLTLDYNFTTNFFLRAETQQGSVSSVIDSAGLGAGLAKTWPTARVYGFLEGRRNWITANWEGVGGIGAAWSPAQAGGLLSNFSLFAEQRLVISRNNQQPATETVAGIRYSF